jgi:cytochrome oxidase Cu insertion factor (SCO1/SenC/PrrC family)
VFKPSFVKLLLFIPVFFAAFFTFYQVKKWRLDNKRYAINQSIGKQFPNLPLQDENGNTVSLNVATTELTMVDFWYRNCPACIREMQQFKTVLKGKETGIKVISISIDPDNVWKKTLEGTVPAFSFFADRVPNWQHLLVNFPGHDTGKSNAQQLSEILSVTSFPSYFVLNNKGIIVATPPSAVDYITTPTNNRNGFVVFFGAKSTWSSLKTLLFIIIVILVYNKLFDFAAKKVIKKRAA